MNMSLTNTVYKEASIADLLLTTDNNYCLLEKKYFSRYNKQLLSKQVLPNKYRFSTKISIIIPSYNSSDTVVGTLLTIDNQILSDTERDLLEVIVVDDGSTDDTDQKIIQQKYKFELKYIKQPNAGRSAARNSGVQISTGDILIFLDSDVLLEKHFVRESVLRCEALHDSVFLSFKENVYIDSSKIFNFIEHADRPNIEKDFRFSKAITPQWKRIHRLNTPIETRTVRLMKESNNLKDFGNGNVLGVWDLPSIALTCSITMKKKTFLNTGGFNLAFEGWGMEDTFLGACLIANGNYIIPVYSTGVFHIKHDYRSGNEVNQINEFNKNVNIYNKLIKKTLKEISSDLH